MARILVIDDEASLRQTLKVVLEKAGHSVAEAPDGKIALRLCRKEPLDLIITDIIMPDMEGIETIKEVRRELPDIQIIAMSAGGIIEPENYLTIARAMGAAQTFTKPFDLKLLMEAVQELVDERD